MQKSVARDSEGYLVHPEDRDKATTRAIASEEAARLEYRLTL